MFCTLRFQKHVMSDCIMSSRVNQHSGALHSETRIDINNRTKPYRNYGFITINRAALIHIKTNNFRLKTLVCGSLDIHTLSFDVSAGGAL